MDCRIKEEEEEEKEEDEATITLLRPPSIGPPSPSRVTHNCICRNRAIVARAHTHSLSLSPPPTIQSPSQSLSNFFFKIKKDKSLRGEEESRNKAMRRCDGELSSSSSSSPCASRAQRKKLKCGKKGEMIPTSIVVSPF